MNLQTKFDYENVNNSSIDPESYSGGTKTNNGEMVVFNDQSDRTSTQFSTKQGSTSISNPLKLKKVESENTKEIDNDLEDPTFCEIVKKYKIERRVNQNPKQSRVSRLPSCENRTTPKRQIANSLQVKGSFSVTPKVKEIRAPLKDIVSNSTRLNKLKSNSTEDITQFSNVKFLYKLFRKS